MSNLSFQEKSTLGSLAVTVAAALYYFGTVFPAYAAGSEVDGRWVIGFGIGVIVLIVVAEIVVQALLHLVSKEERDERDRLIDALSTRNAYYVLAVSLFILVVHLGFQALTGTGPGIVLDTALTTVALVFALVVADVALDVSKLVYYRRGL